MTEPTDALMPCPFCGEAAKHSFNSLYGDMSMASCKSCGATAYAPKWNRRAVLAKWGSPVVAGEPCGWAVFRPDGSLVHGSCEDSADACLFALSGSEVACGKKPGFMAENNGWKPHPIYTTAQPTQAQAGAVPLTDEHKEDLYIGLERLSKLLEGSGRIDEHDTPEAYSTVLDAMNLVRAAQQDTALIRQLVEALGRCRFDSLNMSIADMNACATAAKAGRARLPKAATKNGD